MIKLKSTVEHLILKWFQYIIDFLMNLSLKN